MKEHFRSYWLACFVAAFVVAVALPAHAKKGKRHESARGQTWTFQVASNAVIAVGTNHAASLDNLKVGDRILIGFKQENGTLVAERIMDGVTRVTPRPKGSPKGGAHHSKSASGMAHAQGEIQSVDLQAHRVTIVAKGHRAA